MKGAIQFLKDIGWFKKKPLQKVRGTFQVKGKQTGEMLTVTIEGTNKQSVANLTNTLRGYAEGYEPLDTDRIFKYFDRKLMRKFQGYSDTTF